MAARLTIVKEEFVNTSVKRHAVNTEINGVAAHMSSSVWMVNAG